MPQTPPRPRRYAREGAVSTPAPPAAPPCPSLAAAPPAPSKIALVRALLQRPCGASLAELVEATGWLPHTTRAALSGIKKKGYRLEKSKREKESRYTLPDAG